MWMLTPQNKKFQIFRKSEAKKACYQPWSFRTGISDATVLILFLHFIYKYKIDKALLFRWNPICG